MLKFAARLPVRTVRATVKIVPERALMDDPSVESVRQKLILHLEPTHL
jgi:hypothetical protein